MLRRIPTESISTIKTGVQLIMSRWPNLYTCLDKLTLYRKEQLNNAIFHFFTRSTEPDISVESLTRLILGTYFGCHMNAELVEPVAQTLMTVFEACLEESSRTNENIMEVFRQEVYDVDDYEDNDEDYDRDDPMPFKH